MIEVLLSILNGAVNLPWWGYIVVALVFTHITIASVTIYLHRHQAHRALDLGPIPSHFFRFWLWMTTGMETKQWAAIHRKHHARCETAEDPHSPQVLGIKKVLLEGSELYRAAAKDQSIMDKFGHGTPDDWIEKNLYTKHSALGVTLMMILNLILFGVNGIWIWAVQMIWIPVTAAGIINGIGHYWGYRNYDCEDASTNVFPWGILIGGEELHNNHHTFGTSAKLSSKWYEFDIGWMYIQILCFLGMAKVLRVAPTPKLIPAKNVCDEATLQAIITNRYDVVTRFSQHLKDTCVAELRSVQAKLPTLNVQKWRKTVSLDAASLADDEHAELKQILQHSAVLETVHTMRQELAALWARSSLTSDQLVKQLQDWCARAEASGIEALREFSLRLRCYAVA